MRAATEPAAARARASIPVGTLSGELGTFFAAEAAARGVSPRVLVLALLQKVRVDALVAPVLDGDDPNELAPGHARRLDGLTRLQSGVLYVMALNADCHGVALLTPGRLSYLLSVSAGSAITARAALVGRGYIEPTGTDWRRGCTGPRPYRITDAGWRMARTLGGDIVQAGGAA